MALLAAIPIACRCKYEEIWTPEDIANIEKIIFKMALRTEENEEAFQVLKELTKVKKKLLKDDIPSIELARSYFYLGTISIEASKISVALETLKDGMDILNTI